MPEEVAVSVLIPNERGLDARWRCARPHRGEQTAFDEINVFLSASETHNRKNVNRSIAESLDGPGASYWDAHARRGCAARA